MEESRGGLRNGAESATDRLEVDEAAQPLLSHGDRNTLPTDRRLTERVASLDVFRGLTIAVMILVDDAGGSWPTINHSPWNGITLADFVMPFFLFIVGVSIVLAMQKVSDQRCAIKKVAIRFLKLFALGLLLQGGYFHTGNDLGYGVDIVHIRIMGILQRIAIAYLIVAICESCTSNSCNSDTVRGVCQLLKTYHWHWIVAFMLLSLYLGLLYGLHIPTWQFRAPITTYGFNSSQEEEIFMVTCNVRGDLGPACNAVGFIDRSIMGINHLYKRPVYQRTKECSMKSPDYGPPPLNAPAWCLAPFDPEGILSSVMAVVSCIIGSHYGHVLVNFKGHKRRLLEWIICSFVLLLIGIVVCLLGMPFSKPLYTFSYTCLTAGAAGLVFSAFYVVVDVYEWSWPLLLLEWMGMNAMLIYTLAACDIFSIAVKGFYWRSPDLNLVNFTERIFQHIIHLPKLAKLVFVLFEILFWCLIAGALKYKRIFWKV